MNVNSLATMNYENIIDWTLGENKPNSNPICQRVKLMQSLYLQRIMKKNAAKGYEKTKPKQTQFKPNSNPISKQLQGKRYFSLDFSGQMGIIIFVNGLIGVVSSALYVKLFCPRGEGQVHSKGAYKLYRRGCYLGSLPKAGS